MPEGTQTPDTVDMQQLIKTVSDLATRAAVLVNRYEKFYDETVIAFKGDPGPQGPESRERRERKGISVPSGLRD